MAYITRYFPVFVLHAYVKKNEKKTAHAITTVCIQPGKKRKQRLKRMNDVERVGKRRRRNKQTNKRKKENNKYK
jgi:hypothetical protein